MSYRQELDLQHGILLRAIRFEDQQGRRTLLQEQRLVSMSDMHLGALELSLTAENWSGSVTIRSAIDVSETKLSLDQIVRERAYLLWGERRLPA